MDERYLSEIIEARLVQIFETVRDDLEAVDAMDLPGGFVLTGGASSLPGVLELAEEFFGQQVRIYIPEQMGMRNPIYTTSMGMVEYVAGLDEVHRIAQATFRSQRAQHAVQEEQHRPNYGSQFVGGRRPGERGGNVDRTYPRGQNQDESEGYDVRRVGNIGDGRTPRNQIFEMKPSRDSNRSTRPTNESYGQGEYDSNVMDEYNQFNRQSSSNYQSNEEAVYYEDYPQEMNRPEGNQDETSNETGFANKIRSFFQTFFD